MKSLILSFGLILSNLCFANLQLAPPSFEIPEGNVVFIDIIKAKYKIIYDTKARKAFAESTITFRNAQAGLPLFDLVPNINSIELDGVATEQKLIKLPQTNGPARVVLQITAPGLHTLKTKHFIKENTKFGWPRRKVNSGFFIVDLKARRFVEQYLPTNLEFDQFPVTIETKVTGTTRSHKLMANGKIMELARNHYKVTYPDFYTASSIYFHLFPTGKYKWTKNTYTSIDGREIDFTIYAKPLHSLRRYYKKTLRLFKELEADYGPWPYDSLLVFATGISGGMEWPGATTTTLGALDHEMLHSYFAKGVFPANGNSGWMDEGIASWRDYGYESWSQPSYGSINLGNHSLYQRNTDDRSYKVGRSFFNYINYKMQNMGGLKPVLKRFFEKRKFTVVTTQDMIRDFEEFTGLNLQDDFDYYVFGMGTDREEYVSVEESLHQHHQFTQEEINSLID